MHPVELRPFTPAEYHAFYRRYVPDPAVGPAPFVYSREQVDRSFRYHYGGFQPHSAHFGIFRGPEPVGSLQFLRMNPASGAGEFGIILRDESVRNQGIGTAAVALAIAIARDQFHLRVLTGDTMGRNRRMIRVFEKLGFRLTETVPAAFRLPDGTLEDRLVYRLPLTAEDS